MSQPTTTPTALPVKEIAYDRETSDFAMYLDGELVGYARSYFEAEQALNELVYNFLLREAELAATPSRPADLVDADPTDAEVLALAEQLVGELNQVERQAEAAGAEGRDALAATLWGAYESLSARIRALGYDVGPGDGALVLYSVQTQRPLVPQPWERAA